MRDKSELQSRQFKTCMYTIAIRYVSPIIHGISHAAEKHHFFPQQRASQVPCVPRNLPGQRLRERRSGARLLAKECWHKERPKPKVAAKVSQKLARQGRRRLEMDYRQATVAEFAHLVISKLLKIPRSEKSPGREKLAAKEPLEVVHRLSRLHPVGCPFLWQRDSRTSGCR